MSTDLNTSAALPATASRNYGLYAFALIFGLLVLRVIALIISPVGLHGDEAQYWSWAQDLDWGYFSKPPLIAWTIASTTAVFGDAEWAVRLSSPIIHAGTASLLYLIGARLFDNRTGFWAVLFYYLMPAVSLSAGIVSTDVTLLFCWSLALYGLVRLREGAAWRWALMMGAGIGLGMMAKYAMLFFLPALAISIVIDTDMRRAVLSRYGALAGLIAALIFAPNIWWNFSHDFATVTHTAANTNLDAKETLNIGELFKFWGDQLAVFGPITFILYILAIIAAWRGTLSDNAKWLSLFVLTPILVISFQAWLSRANANWAVSSYIGGALLSAHYVNALMKRRNIAKTAIGLNVVLGLTIVTLALAPSLADRLGQANAFKRTRGWQQTVDAVRAAAKKGHEGQAFQTIAADNRLVFYDLNYYGVETSAPLRMWFNTPHPNNHAEATAPLSAQDAGPVLIVSQYESNGPVFTRSFERVESAGQIDIDLGGGKRRVLRLWAGYGFIPVQDRKP